MSATVLYQIQQSGEINTFDEVNNSFLSGNKIWRVLSEAYGFNSSPMAPPTQCWDAFAKGVYKDFEDIVLGTTFDNVIVKKENMQRVIDAFIKFDEVYPGTSLREQADILELMLKKKDTIGVAWQQTDSGDSTWLPDYDDDENEILYNINKRSDHWELFSDLDG